MLTAYLELLCEFFWEFAIFHFCRPLVDIYWHPLLMSLIPSFPPHRSEDTEGFLSCKAKHTSEYLSWLVRKLWLVWKLCCLSIKVIIQLLVGVMSASENDTHNHGIWYGWLVIWHYFNSSFFFYASVSLLIDRNWKRPPLMAAIL